MTRLGIVAIGRNEGERLVRCLESLLRSACVPIVYADSGSTDGSAARARALGVVVVELDPLLPFSAARGRNEGFARLLADHPELELVQFIDADCELREGWLEHASAHLAEHPAVAVVCGRRRERHPERSPYNQLADLEWNTPIGAALACGGDALIRVGPLREVGGYRDDMVAGEEPELCSRLRAAGHGIARIDHEMTLHDAATTGRSA
jgi:GT2 family glycosyltransferase